MNYYIIYIRMFKSEKEKEPTLLEIRNKRIEHERKLAQDIKDKELEKLQEEKRIHKILVPYLDKLQDSVEEKDLLSFWIFTDDPGCANCY